MSCTATSGYLTLLPYYPDESKLNIQDQFIDNLKSYHWSHLQLWKQVISTVPTFTKTDIPAVLKDTKEIPLGHLILNAYKSRKSGKHSVPRWTCLTTTIPTLTILGVEILLSFINIRKNLPRFTG